MREVVAAHGRYFPIGAAELVAATSGWVLEAKGRLALENPNQRLAEAQAVARLRPGRDVTLFSLPLDVSRPVGARVAREALRALAAWKDDNGRTREGLSRAIVVYMPGPHCLHLVEHRVKYGRRKFGAGEGLASSRKPRVTSEHIIELGVVRFEPG